MPKELPTWANGNRMSILIESYSSSALTLEIHGITENEEIDGRHTTNSDRSLASSSVSVTAIPSAIFVKASSTGIKRGVCFVRITLQGGGRQLALLAQGYVSDSENLSFPNGPIKGSLEGPGLMRSITGTDPAAGINVSETVPTGARWRLHTLHAVLVTDATVSNRTSFISISDGTNLVGVHGALQAQAASNTFRYSLSPTLAKGDNSAGYITIGFPPFLLLPAGYIIATITANLQAGDNWGAPQMLVEEWIQP